MGRRGEERGGEGREEGQGERETEREREEREKGGGGGDSGRGEIMERREGWTGVGREGEEREGR